MSYCVCEMERIHLDKVIESLKAEIRFWQSFIKELEGGTDSAEYKRARDALRFAELQLLRYEEWLELEQTDSH